LTIVNPPLARLSTSQATIRRVTKTNKSTTPNASNYDDLCDFTADVVALKAAELSSCCSLEDIHEEYEEVDKRLRARCSPTESFEGFTGSSHTRGIPCGYLAAIE
jgi:hypothetical protein